ncbi:uncharacterized protein [Dermacentor albipictus]|uniref:uncharacterized protein n=1 Tax=Dermacentor albipictus TaxID=60249 RepID=UPI0038FC782A
MAEQQLQHDKKSSKVTTFNRAAPATTDATRGRPHYRSRRHSQSQSRSRSRVHRSSMDQKQPRGRSRSGSRSLTQQKQPPKEPQAAWTKTPDHLTRKTTADILVQPKDDVVDGPSKAQTRAILALDLKGAFDNVSGDLILNNLAFSRCGKRICDYARAFLSDRAATIGRGDIRSDILKLSGRGTPQGSVLSPTLFNGAMAKVPPLLDKLPNVLHALYADDITIWVTTGSDGAIKDALQEAVNIVQEYATAGGLTCAADKSELLLVLKKRNKADIPPAITLHLSGTLFQG